MTDVTSNNSDAKADALAALVLITVTVVAAVYWVAAQ